MVHLSVCLTPGIRAKLMDRFGEDPYKGLFSLLIVASIVLIVLGWRGSVPYPVYDPPQWGRIVAVILMAVALILFLASSLPTNLKRVMRHPQLTGIVLWAAAHLLSNGDRRSIVLFVGLALWSIAEIVVINRRDAVWVKPSAVAVSKDLLPVVFGAIVFVLLYWLHPYFTGVPLVLR